MDLYGSCFLGSTGGKEPANVGYVREKCGSDP